jgi:hypothetical protein
MENNQLGIYGHENPIANFSHENNHQASNDDFGSTFPTSDFYDDGGNYKTETFETLGGLHYMNYLHSHDDML